MNDHTAFEGSLHDYVSGDLPADRREAFEAHLAVCPRCRRDAAELRDLLLAAATLPATLEPSRDLWPEIEARLKTLPAAARVEDRRVRGVAGQPRPGLRQYRAVPRTWTTWSGWTVAAALVVYLALARPPVSDQLRVRREAAQPEPPPVAALLHDLRVLEGGSVQAHNEFAALLSERGDDLAPETLDVIEGNLRLIDMAISETRAALAADPYNAHLARRLAGGYQDRIALLRRAVWLTARSQGARPL